MCGCTSARAHWVKDLEDRCPSCGRIGDTSTHVTRCEDPGSRDTFKKSVTHLTKWMEDNETEPHLLTMILDYLMERDNKTIEWIISKMYNAYLVTMEDQDWNKKLKWKSD